MDSEIPLSDIEAWLGRLRGPSFTENAARQAASEMREIGASRVFPGLRRLLADPDPETRCLASLGLFVTDPLAAVDLLLPLLGDPEAFVRWNACGLLHDIADKRTVEPLIQAMKTDPDPQVRNTAAYALGGVGDPAAIPALVQTMDSDHEYDELGHSASSCAATALDDILPTHHTRIKNSDNLCTMQSEPLDHHALKIAALEFYETMQ